MTVKKQKYIYIHTQVYIFNFRAVFVEFRSFTKRIAVSTNHLVVKYFFLIVQMIRRKTKCRYRKTYARVLSSDNGIIHECYCGVACRRIEWPEDTAESNYKYFIFYMTHTWCSLLTAAVSEYWFLDKIEFLFFTFFIYLNECYTRRVMDKYNIIRLNMYNIYNIKPIDCWP